MEGYVYLISPIRTATNGVTKYFDMKLQNSETSAVHMVCYLPEKQQALLQSQQTKSPGKVDGLSKNQSKQFSSEDDEYTILKKAKITHISLDFQSDYSFSSRFHKVKVMIKSDSKQPIIKGGKTKYNLDGTGADKTGAVKVTLW